MRLTHSFPIFLNKDSQVLILGSFPSVKSRELDFYYMHKQNRFYKILSNLFNEDFYSISTEEKKRLLKKYKIALYDVCEECEINNSSDETIKNVIPIDLDNILNNSNIHQIFINGNKAKELFIQYHSKYLYMTKFLPSSSARNARMSLDDLTNKYQIIKEYLN